MLAEASIHTVLSVSGAAETCGLQWIVCLKFQSGKACNNDKAWRVRVWHASIINLISAHNGVGGHCQRSKFQIFDFFLQLSILSAATLSKLLIEIPSVRVQ